MQVVAVVQARMGSSRLPGKSLLPLGSATVLDWVVERVGAASQIADVIVATSTNDEDDALAAHLAARRGRVVRGHPTDVLARFADAVSEVDADAIVRITADCPFIEPDLIDFGIDLFQRTEVQYVATGLDGRMPHGLDLEVVDRGALLEAAGNASDPIEREHVTPYIVRRPDRFAHSPLIAPLWARRPELRFTLDEPDDYRLITAVRDELDATPSSLSAREVIELLVDRSDLVELNRAVAHRNVT